VGKEGIVKGEKNTGQYQKELAGMGHITNPHRRALKDLKKKIERTRKLRIHALCLIPPEKVKEKSPGIPARGRHQKARIGGEKLQNKN